MSSTAPSFVVRACASTLGAALLLGGCSMADRALGVGGGSSSPVASKPPSLGFVNSASRPNFNAASESALAQLNPNAPNDPLLYLREAAEEATRAKQPLAAATHWASIVAATPEDMEATYQLGRNLRLIGRNEEAERALRVGLRARPQDSRFAKELGKTLAADGRPDEAAALLEQAAVAAPADADLLSALGAAYDYAGRHDQARAYHQRAMAVAPHEAAVLNNAGLSLAMGGDLPGAEKTLRDALAAPDADARVRQNLALVLSLQGDSAGAERLLRRDLPRAEADQTLAFYKSLVDQPDAWGAIRKNN